MGTEVAELKTAAPQRSAMVFENMKEVMRGAELMSNAQNVVPKHLIGNPGGCMAIIMQAQRWGMDAFVVAQKTHVVSGTLGYEAQLVNAVVQNSGMIVGSFKYEYDGDAGTMRCRVGAVLRGESQITWGEWLGVNEVQTKNSPLWKTNPKQQMGYLQVKNWVRLYAPGALLGVYTVDELRDAPIPERDITPDRQEAPASRTAALAQQLRDAEAAKAEPQSEPQGDQAEPADEPKAPDPYMGPTFAEISEAILACQTAADCSKASKLVAAFGAHPDNESMREELAANFRAHRAKLKAAEATKES